MKAKAETKEEKRERKRKNTAWPKASKKEF
jgi:hypothetical protein